MAQPSALFVLLTIVTMITTMNVMSVGAKNWCVAKKDAGYQQLLSALDYACANGADCGAIQPGGICFEPNTILHHASYAFDSYYRRKGEATDTCNFGGTATITETDPSFGSCIFPASLRIAGEAYTPPVTTTNVKERLMDSSKRAELDHTLPN